MPSPPSEKKCFSHFLWDFTLAYPDQGDIWQFWSIWERNTKALPLAQGESVSAVLLCV